MNLRRLVRAARGSKAGHGDAFSALRLTPDLFGAEGSPWFNIDHFHMAGPTFPPHPHAGFSAVTYVLPRSANGMRNRDSRGDRSLIPPGGIHWTAAGSGIVHEEIPDSPGQLCEGFQIFVRQPPDQERSPPVIAHADPAEIPDIVLPGGAKARLLAGSWNGTDAPVAPPSPLVMMDVELGQGSMLEWQGPTGWTLGVYLYDGAVAVEGVDRTLNAPLLLAWERGEGLVVIRPVEQPCRLLLMAGEPVDAPAYSNGPFLLSSPEAMHDAVARYQRGAMGMLPPEW
ncbi:MAG: pirin family protein [Sphingobium sp.]